MKISKIFVALLAICAVVACKPDNNSGSGNSGDSTWSSNGSPIGEWVLTQWNDSKELPFGVYLRLNEDNTFDLYQHTYSVLWVHYSGTFSISGTTLSGTYSDGVQWGGEYTIEYATSPKMIRLSKKGVTGEKDEAIYAETTIPAEVQDEATEATNVRSVAVERFL
jgi:hypothetical protein